MELICLVTQSQYFCVVETKIEKKKKKKKIKHLDLRYWAPLEFQVLSLSLSLLHIWGPLVDNG
jgi:hypothetical protein